MASPDPNLSQAIVLGAFTALLTAFGFLVKYLLHAKDEDTNRRLGEERAAREKLDTESTKKIERVEAESNRKVERLEAEVVRLRDDKRQLEARVTADEKETERINGRCALVEQKSSAIIDDIEEIKRQQVPRAEWEREMANVRRALADILSEVRGRGARRTESESGLPASR